MDNNHLPPDYPEIKRTYTPEEAGHERTRRPVSRYSPKRLKRKKANPGVVLLVLVFAVVFAVTLFLIISGKNRTDLPADTTDILSGRETSSDMGEVTAPVTTDDGLPYLEISVPQHQMYYGDLILVNSQHEYFFPAEAESEIVDLKDAKNEYYGLSDYSTGLSRHVVDRFNTLCTDYFNFSGFKWMQVNSSYRSKQEQTDLYAEYTELYGADYAKAYVANPGFSEHHTGLAMDLNVNVDGSIYYVESYEGCQWFRENADDYGFILRYPHDKVYMTGINYESWHYRYVGIPHSQIMSDMNFCLEEYITYLKGYTYDTKCLGYDASTGGYDITEPESYDGGTMIYYVPCEGESTTVKVPKKSEYSLSGNNVDGFVVTVTGMSDNSN